MRHENISPTDATDRHRNHAGCFYQKTRIAPMRTDGSFHGFFTLAPLPTAWVIDAPPAQRIATDFFAGGELCGRMSHDGLAWYAKNLWKSARSVGDN